MELKLNILVLDDSYDARIHIENELKILGHNVFSFSNGESAINFLRSCGEKIDLILTDINMPEMDGICFSRVARVLSKNSVIIAVTTELDKQMKLLGKKAGIKAWSNKPINTEKLFLALEKLEKRKSKNVWILEKNRKEN